MKTIFNLIVHILEYLSSIFKVSYVEMNIIIYYIIIPITWALMLDVIFGIHYFKITALIVYFLFFLLIDNWIQFSEKLFLLSVQWLNKSYIKNSVVICVFVPLVIYLVLIILILIKP